MQCLHVKTNRRKGEPRVMLQEHSSGWGGWAPHQQMDKPRRRMRAKLQMYQRPAGAWKCQVSPASHAVTAIYTIHHVLDVHIRSCEQRWQGLRVRALPCRGGGEQERWAGDSPLYEPWIQTAWEEPPWPYVLRQVGSGNVNTTKGCAWQQPLSHILIISSAWKAVLIPGASVDWSW